VTRDFEIRPIDAPLGAEVLGFDFAAEMDEAAYRRLREALVERQLLVFRDAALEPERQIAFSGRFGEIQLHVLNQYTDGKHPEIFFITNLDDDGKPRGEHPDPGAMEWHTDGSWSRRPGLFTLLYGVALPLQGGETEFASMSAAWDALDPALRAEIEGLRAVHDLDYSRRLTKVRAQMTEEQKRAAPPVEQPVVRRHPETGRKVVYLGSHASHIVGMPIEEGRALIARVNAAVTAPRFVYRHLWAERDLVAWDNRSVLHRAGDYDWMGDRRIMRRTTTLVAEPVAG
jgi:taurine dioxygenase